MIANTKNYWTEYELVILLLKLGFVVLEPSTANHDLIVGYKASMVRLTLPSTKRDPMKYDLIEILVEHIVPHLQKHERSKCLSALLALDHEETKKQRDGQ